MILLILSDGILYGNLHVPVSSHDVYVGANDSYKQRLRRPIEEVWLRPVYRSSGRFDLDSLRVHSH